MATLRQYAYYIKGNKIGIVENDATPDNDPSNRDYGPDTRVSRYVSPIETISDGLQIEYTYSPEYYIRKNLNETVESSTADGSVTNDDYFGAIELSSPTWDEQASLSFYLTYFKKGSDVTSAFTVGSFVYITNNPLYNGLHKIGESGYAGGTSLNTITFETPIQKPNHQAMSLDISNANFNNDINKGNLYYGIKKMQDESFDIDISPYMGKAVVAYVKAKMAEDAGDFKLKEYFMREFKKMLEKKQSAKVSGPRFIVSGPNAIR